MSDSHRGQNGEAGVDGYSDEGFWHKVKQFAKLAGREVIDNALCLY